MKLKEIKIYEQRRDDPNSTRSNTEQQIIQASENQRKEMYNISNRNGQ